LVADRHPTKTAEAVGLTGDEPSSDQELFNVVSLAGQREPSFVTQLPAGIDQERGGFQLAMPCQPTQRLVTD